MHCAACVGRVTAALRALADNVTVTLQPPRAIMHNPKTGDIAALNAAVAKGRGLHLEPPCGEPPSGGER